MLLCRGMVKEKANQYGKDKKFFKRSAARPVDRRQLFFDDTVGNGLAQAADLGQEGSRRIVD